MLRDATNEIRNDCDTQVAIDCTVNEALEVMNQWATENADKELAEKLAKQLEAEEKERMQAEAAKGEAVALRVAIDETRRIKAEAKEREMREQQDSAFAKSVYEAEEKDVKMSQQLLEEDEKLARQLSEGESKGDDRDCFVAEEKCCDSPVSESKYDSKRGSKDEEEDEEGFLREISARFEQLTADEQVAMQEQRALDDARRALEATQQSKDYLLSRRLAVKTEREAHKQRKYREMQQSFERCQRGHEAVGRLWEACEAEVDDVCDAVCITLLLPNILDLKVRVVKNGRKVCIDAKRFVHPQDRFASVENSAYLAEFKVQGRNVQVADNSVSYDYSSDTGLLHIYIEGVSLQDNAASGAESAEYSAMASGGSSSGKGPSAGAGARLPSAKMVADAVKSGFMRVFGSSSKA